MMVRKLLLVIISSIILSACKSTSSVQSSQYATENGNDTDSFLAIKQRFHQQLAKVEKSNDVISLQQALATGERFIQLQPYQDEEVAKVYRLKMLNYLTMPSQPSWRALDSFYKQHPSLRYFEMASPSFIKVVSSMEGIASDTTTPEQLRAWLKQAILENPGFVRAKDLLAALYIDDDQIELATFLYAQLVKLHPDNKDYVKNYADAQWLLSFDKMCSPISDKAVNVAIKAQQNLVKMAPQTLSYQADLANLYQLAGRNRLMEFTLKQLATKDPQYNDVYAESLIWRGKPQQAAQFYNDLEFRQQHDDWYYGAVYEALMRQDWQAAAGLAEVIDKDPEPSVYAIIYVAQAMQHQGFSEQAEDFLNRNQSRYEASAWKDTLFHYAQHQIDDQQLLSSAKDKCELSEAHFMLGLQELLKGEQQRWRAHIQQVVDLQVFAFYEHATGRYWLKQHPSRSL